MTAADCTCEACTARPSREDLAKILAEMDRHGPNRGWVLAGVIIRARLGDRLAPWGRP